MTNRLVALTCSVYLSAMIAVADRGDGVGIGRGVVPYTLGAHASVTISVKFLAFNSSSFLTCPQIGRLTGGRFLIG